MTLLYLLKAKRAPKRSLLMSRYGFSEISNDHQSNGMTCERITIGAMDHKLIAQHPDNFWLASASLDDRIIVHHSLLELRKKSLIAPVEKRSLPTRVASMANRNHGVVLK